MDDFQHQFYKALKKVVKASSMKIHDYKEYEKVLCRLIKPRRNDICDLAERRLLKIYKVALIEGKSRLIPANNGSTRIVCYVYLEEIYSILQETHIRMDHGDCQSMFNEIKYKYVNITIDIIQLYLSFCKACLPKKNTDMKSLDEIMYQEMNSRCHLDIIDVKPHYDGDYKYILCYEDYKTKYCFLRPLKSVCPNEVTNIVVDIFTTIGAPNILQTNRGSKFTHSLIQLLTEMWPYLRIVPGQSTHDDNENIRNLIFTHHKGIKSFGNYRWTKVLGFIQMKKNRLFNADIQKTPFEAMFGRAVKIGLIDSVVSKKDIGSLRTENDLRTVLCSYINEKCSLLNKSSDDETETPSTMPLVETVKDEAGINKKDDTNKEAQQGTKTRKSRYFIGYEVKNDKDSNKKKRKKIKLQEIGNAKDIEAVYINEQPPMRIKSQSDDDPLTVQPDTSSDSKINIVKGNDDKFYKNNCNLIKANMNPVVIISEELELQRHIRNIKMDHSYNMRTEIEDVMAANDSMDVSNVEEAIDDSNLSCIKTTEDIENFIFANTLDKGTAFKQTGTIKNEFSKELQNPKNSEVKLEYGSEKEEIQVVPDNLKKRTRKVKKVAQSSQNAELINKVKFKRNKAVKFNPQSTKRVTRSSTRAMNSSKPADPSTNLSVTKFDRKYGNKVRKSNEPDENCRISLRSHKSSTKYKYAERVDHVKEEIIEEINSVLENENNLSESEIDLKTFQRLQHAVIPTMAIAFDRKDDDVNEDLCIYGNLIDPITGESTLEKYFVGCSCQTDCKQNNKCPCKLKSILCNIKCHNAEECKN